MSSKTSLQIEDVPLAEEEMDKIAPGYLNSFEQANEHRWKVAPFEGLNDIYTVFYDYSGAWYNFWFITIKDMNLKAYNEILKEHRKESIRRFKAVLAEVD